MRIRKDQIAAFERARVDKFIARVVACLAEHWSELTAELGQRGLEELVTAGIRKAARYGVDTERALLRFANVMCLLGSDFDEAVEHAWIREILEAPGDPEAKLEAICSTLRAHNSETEGR